MQILLYISLFLSPAITIIQFNYKIDYNKLPLHNEYNNYNKFQSNNEYNDYNKFQSKNEYDDYHHFQATKQDNENNQFKFKNKEKKKSKFFTFIFIIFIISIFITIIINKIGEKINYQDSKFKEIPAQKINYEYSEFGRQRYEKAMTQSKRTPSKSYDQFLAEDIGEQTLKEIYKEKKYQYTRQELENDLDKIYRFNRQKKQKEIQKLINQYENNLNQNNRNNQLLNPNNTPNPIQQNIIEPMKNNINQEKQPQE